MSDLYHTTQEPVRIMFPDLAKPRAAQKGKEPRYGVMVLIKKDSPEHEAIKRIVVAAMEENFGKAIKLVGRQNPIKDCVTTDKKRELEGKQPMFTKLEDADQFVYLNASSQNRPGMIDKDLNELLDLSCFKSGSYVRVNVNAWTWENSGEKGVSIGLNHVQFWAEGESLNTGGVGTGASGAKAAFGGLGGKIDDGGTPDVDAIFG